MNRHSAPGPEIDRLDPAPPKPDPLSRPTDRRRHARAAWLDRLERWTEWPLTVLALALVPILLAPYLFSLSDDVEQTLLGVDYLIWGVFAADLIVKVAVAPDRRRYLRRHWFDVVLVALPLLRPLRVVRSARALRALGAWRAAVAVVRILAGARALLARRGLGYALLAGLVTVVAAGGLIAVVERDHPDATIRSFADGLWWAATTVTTVGYGDTYPRTAFGRGVGVALMVLGIALFGVVTASLAAFFVEEHDANVAPAPSPEDPSARERHDALAAELREANDRLRRIEAALAAGTGAGRPPS